jgi:thiol-disulfide isomerase/thioredoxin
MRKVFLGFVITFIVFLTAFLLRGIVRKVHNSELIAENIARFPVFSFITLSNETFNSRNIKEGPVLVVHFHPECEHCRHEISEIFRSQIPESFTSVILVSAAHPDSIKVFLKKLNSSDFATVIPLADTAYKFEDVFGRGIIPSIYIYNRKLELIKVLRGEVKTQTILNCIQENGQ